MIKATQSFKGSSLFKLAMERGDKVKSKLSALLGTLSRLDTLGILSLAGRGISGSTYAMKELGLSQKKYYTRLKALVEAGLVEGSDGEYRQTPLGRIIDSHLLPAFERVFVNKDQLRLLEVVKGTKMEEKVRKAFSEELGTIDVLGLQTLRVVDDYESMVIEVIDMYDEADESTLLASNYVDTRVMEACLRSEGRGVVNKLVVGKKGISSKIQQLRMMLSPTFAKVLINFMSKEVDLEDFVRVVDLPYSFFVVDGCHNLIIISDIKNKFIASFIIDDRDVGEKLTDFFENLWKDGDVHPALNFVNSFKSS